MGMGYVPRYKTYVNKTACIDAAVANSWCAFVATYMTIAVPEDAPVISNVSRSSANVSWAPLADVDGYSLRLNKVEIYRGINTSSIVSDLLPNFTYFVTVAGIADWGTDGGEGPSANFTTSV